MQPEMPLEEWQRWQEYYDRLRSWTEYLVGPRLRRRLDASDLAQESWIAAWKGRERFRGRQAEWEDYLRGILRRRLNRVLRHHLSQRRALEREAQLPGVLDASEAQIDRVFFGKDPGPVEQAERAERRLALFNAVAQLRPEQEQAIFLHYVKGLSLAQVSEQMGGVAVTTLAGILHRGIKKLRTLLGAAKE
jgi:RNA polymerase sigma-70 factor, ECF subfamily